MKFFISAALTLTIFISLSAQNSNTNISTWQLYNADRPQLTVSGEILPLKTFAIETGFAVNINNKNSYAFNYNETRIRIGAMKLMEMTFGLRVPGVLVNGNHSAGLASPTAGLKVLMKKKENGDKMGLAFVGAAGINFGTENFKDTKVLPSFKVAMDVDISKKTNLRVNYGAEWLENRNVIDPEGNPVIDPFFVVSGNINHVLSEKILLFTELFVNVKYDNFRSDYLLNAGLAYRLKNNVQLDFAAGAGLSPDSPRGNLRIGFSGLWPRKNFGIN